MGVRSLLTHAWLWPATPLKLCLVIEVSPEVEERSAVRRVWEPLGIPGLVDVHTHFMPDNVMRKVWAYFDEIGRAHV